MKKKWLRIRVIVSICAALGWWGLLYPELTLTPEVLRVSVENEDGTFSDLPQEWNFDSNLYWKLLDAGQGKITFRSKLLTNLSLFWEAIHDGNK